MMKNNKAFINLTLFGLSLILSWSLIDYFLNSSYFYQATKAESGVVCEYVKWPGAELNAIPVSENVDGPVIVTSSPIYISRGNVGIGTRNPQYELDVLGKIAANALCLGGDCRSSWLDIGDNFWKLTLDSKLYPSSTNWNVGIGTNNPQYRLHTELNNTTTNPAFYINFYNLAQFGIYRSNSIKNCVMLRDYAGNGLSLMSFKTGEFQYPFQIGLKISRVTNTTVILPIYDANGNIIGESEEIIPDNYVGIGTDTPQYKLHVVGTTSVSALCLGGDCRSSWPVESMFNQFWKLSNNNLFTSSTNWNIGIGTDSPLGKFHVKSDSYIPGILEMANPNGSGLTLELRKSFVTSSGEDPYIKFSKQIYSSGEYKMFGYIQAGEKGFNIVPQPINVNIIDPISGLGRRQKVSLTNINPFGGNVNIGSPSATTTVGLFGDLKLWSIYAANFISSKKIYIGKNGFDPFTLNYNTGTLRIYFDNNRGLILKNTLDDVTKFLNPALLNRVNFALGSNDSSSLSLVSKGNQILVGIGTYNPQYNLHVIGTTSLVDLIVNNALSVSRINYSDGISVYKISSDCDNAGLLTLENQCRTSDNRLISNQYVGKLIK